MLCLESRRCGGGGRRLGPSGWSLRARCPLGELRSALRMEAPPWHRDMGASAAPGPGWKRGKEERKRRKSEERKRKKEPKKRNGDVRWEEEGEQGQKREETGGSWVEENESATNSGRKGGNTGKRGTVKGTRRDLEGNGTRRMGKKGMEGLQGP